MRSGGIPETRETPGNKESVGLRNISKRGAFACSKIVISKERGCKYFESFSNCFSS